MHDERRQELHAAQERGLLERRQQLADGEAVEARAGVGRLAAPGAERGEQPLAVQRRAPVRTPSRARARGPATPSGAPACCTSRTEAGTRRVVRDEQLLLGLDVDVEVRVSLVEIVKGHAGSSRTASTSRR